MANFKDNLWTAARDRAKHAMLSLVYPAFLGNFLFAFAQGHAALEPIQRGVAWLLLVYFVVGFAETLSEAVKRYKPIVFLVDVGEVALMTLAFFALGVYPTASANADREFVWAVLACIFLAPMLWRLAANYGEWAYDLLSLSAIAVCIAARFDLLKYLPTPAFASKVWGGTRVSIFGGASDDQGISALWILMLLYLIVLVLDLGNQWSGVIDEDTGHRASGARTFAVGGMTLSWVQDCRTLRAKQRVVLAVAACAVALVTWLLQSA